MYVGVIQIHIISRINNITKPHVAKKKKKTPSVERWHFALNIKSIRCVLAKWMRLAHFSCNRAAGIIVEGLTWLYFCDSGCTGRMMCLSAASVRPYNISCHVVSHSCCLIYTPLSLLKYIWITQFLVPTKLVKWFVVGLLLSIKILHCLIGFCCLIVLFSYLSKI